MSRATLKRIHGEEFYLKVWETLVERLRRVKYLGSLCGALPHLIEHQKGKRMVRKAAPVDSAVQPDTTSVTNDPARAPDQSHPAGGDQPQQRHLLRRRVRRSRGQVRRPGAALKLGKAREEAS